MIRKGTYILILDIPGIRIRVGALGPVDLKEGCYCYVGSAMNGLDQRIGRHLSKKKKLRWHIDHLTMVSSRTEAYESVGPEVTECMLGDIVRQNGGVPAVKGFGCSDCSCGTHLFFLEKEAEKRLCSAEFLKKHVR